MVFQGTTFLHALDLHGNPGWLAGGDEMLEGDPGGGAPPGRQVNRAEGSLADLLHKVEHGAERQPLEHLNSKQNQLTLFQCRGSPRHILVRIRIRISD